MHRILPIMYGGDKRKREAFAKFDEIWSGFGYGEDDEKRNTEISRRRIENFIQYHSPDVCPYEILHFPFSSPTALISENEVPFLIDIGAIYPFAGRIDEMVKWKSTSQIWAYDFKTSSELSPRYFEGFWLSPQAVGYTLAASQITGKRIQGMMYEGMRISKTNIETQIGFTYVTDANIRLFVDEAKLTSGRIEAANESGCWRQNYALCSSYPSFGFPCKVCEYKLICDSANWKDGARFFVKEPPFDPLDEGKK
jgi:hypothetical protein